MDEKIVETPKELIDFERAVNALAVLLENGDTISFTVDGVSVTADTKRRQEVLARYKLDEEGFDSIIQEILKIIVIIASDSKEEELETLKDKSAELQILKDKIGIVEKNLNMDKLRKKYQLQTTYKTNLLDKFDWEIIIKHFEKRKGELDLFPTVVLRFRIKRPFTEHPPVEKTETFVFECGKDEIETLISDLEEIKKHIEKLENR